MVSLEWKDMPTSQTTLRKIIIPSIFKSIFSLIFFLWKNQRESLYSFLYIFCDGLAKYDNFPDFLWPSSHLSFPLLCFYIRFG